MQAHIDKINEMASVMRKAIEVDEGRTCEDEERIKQLEVKENIPHVLPTIPNTPAVLKAQKWHLKTWEDYELCLDSNLRFVKLSEDFYMLFLQVAFRALCQKATVETKGQHWLIILSNFVVYTHSNHVGFSSSPVSVLNYRPLK